MRRTLLLLTLRQLSESTASAHHTSNWFRHILQRFYIQIGFCSLIYPLSIGHFMRTSERCFFFIEPVVIVTAQTTANKKSVEMVVHLIAERRLKEKDSTQIMLSSRLSLYINCSFFLKLNTRYVTCFDVFHRF